MKICFNNFQRVNKNLSSSQQGTLKVLKTLKCLMYLSTTEANVSH